MKLLEVLSQHDINMSDDQVFKSMKNMGANPAGFDIKYKPRNPNYQVISPSGHHATAVHKAGDDKNVLRINRGTNNLDEDVYFQFAKMVHDNNLAAKNPYFPVFHKIKVYRNKHETANTKYFYTIQMERLSPLQTYRDEDQLAKLFTKVTGRRPATKKASLMRDNIALAILKDEVNDPMLRDALNIIKRMGIGHPDYTTYNIMIRQTQNGPQLVLADPLYE